MRSKGRGELECILIGHAGTLPFIVGTIGSHRKCLSRVRCYDLRLKKNILAAMLRHDYRQQK